MGGLETTEEEMSMIKSHTASKHVFLPQFITRLGNWLGGKSKFAPRLLNHSVHAGDSDTLLVPEGQPLKEGATYFKLLHGRHRADENLDDWGFNGPVFGPLDWFHITYLQTFRFGRDNLEAALATFGDMFVWKGKYYGDAEIFRFTNRKATVLPKRGYSIGVHNDDRDCHDVTINQDGRPIATLIAPEADIQPLVLAGDFHPILSSALRAACNALEEAIGILHYEDDEPVTFLESNEIERLYVAFASVAKEIRDAVAMCESGQNATDEVAGDAHV